MKHSALVMPWTRWKNDAPHRMNANPVSGTMLSISPTHRSDTLAAMFQYGVREALLFLVVLLPFAAAASALLMAVAIRCKSFKEAQASTTVVMLAASLLPLINVFSLGGESAWYVWVPALAQNVLMTHVLKGEALSAAQIGVPWLVCAAITAAGVWFVARTLRSAAVR